MTFKPGEERAVTLTVSPAARASGRNHAKRGRKNCCDENYCIRQELKVPRGERYELCRSVHAEQNAIISAARKDMIGSTIYLVGIENDTNEYVKDARPCALCKRFIINAGIEKIIIRKNKTDFEIIDVDELIKNDESSVGTRGY